MTKKTKGEAACEKKPSDITVAGRMKGNELKKKKCA